MKAKFRLTKILMIAMLFCFEAKKAGAVTDTISANISVNTHWTSNIKYYLKGYIYVTNGATLTIDPGTFIVGAPAPHLGALIVTVGCKIQAVGTPTKPIVFTSSKAAGLRQRGDWGGVILLGHAGHNYPITVNGITSTGAYIEGITPNPNTLFGPIAGRVVLGLPAGSGAGLAENDHDNSGTLKYVRIEFAGYALSPNNEINGLTFGAVGDGTTISYVQVSYANDDSFEWFGGNVNCDHLIAFRGIDDDFDTDNGYSGRQQFGMGLRDPKVADQSQSAGFESDNNADGFTYLPRTNAVFTNFTVTAGDDAAVNYNALFKGALHDRRASHEYIINSILVGYPQGFEIDGGTTNTYVSGNDGTTQGVRDTLAMNNLVTVSDVTKYVTTPSATNSTQAAATVDLLMNHAGNKFSTSNSLLPKLTNPYNLNNPDYRPAVSSVALSGQTYSEKHAQLFANGADTIFKHASDGIDYVGAFDAITDWTKPWANFNPTGSDNPTGGTAVKCVSLAVPTLSTPVITNAVCKTGQILVQAHNGVSNTPYKYLWYSINGKDSTLIDSSTNNHLKDLAQGNYAVKVLAGKCYSKYKSATVQLLKPKFVSVDNVNGKFGVQVDLNTIYTAMSGYSYQIRFKDTVAGQQHAWSPWGGNNKSNTYYNGLTVDSIWRYVPASSGFLTPASLDWEYFTQNPYYNTSNPNNLGGRDTGLIKNHSYVFQIHGRCFSSTGKVVFSDSLTNAKGSTLGIGVIQSKNYKVAATYSGKGLPISVNQDVSDLNASSIASINVSPNPAKGLVKVDIGGFNAQVVIKVVSMNTGQTVSLNKQSVSPKSASFTINLSSLTPGNYILEVSDGAKTLTKQVSVIR